MGTVGRNDPCHCGSGKKYKKCCLSKDEESHSPLTAVGKIDLINSSQPRCGLCGKAKKLKVTECCGQWICDDEEEYVLFSFARNSCDRNHRRLTLCGYHHTEGHTGSWKDCPRCKEDFETEEYVHYGTNEYNFEKLENPPSYEPTK